MKTVKNITVFAFFALMFTGCISASFSTNTKGVGSYQITRQSQLHFYNLTYGLVTKVRANEPQPMAILKGISANSLGGFTTPTVDYVKSMGFVEVGTNDYLLNITIDNVDINIFNNDNVAISLAIVMTDEAGRIVYTQNASAENKKIGEAYTLALEQINWNRIASFLKVEKLAKNEPLKKVEGLGNTSLEQTIVRWDIQSRPQGADIFWRVVSKTPDVKSTNNKYLMTTPYEATKAIDIKGLTYETASNVRIILRCEKDGYMPQEKEFDVRMVIDQEEISAFFRLVKDE